MDALVRRGNDTEGGGGQSTAAASASSSSGAAKFGNVISHLQYAFASMMHSLNSVVSVQPLVEYLGIDPKVQQDFEEFSSLLRWVVNWLVEVV